MQSDMHISAAEKKEMSKRLEQNRESLNDALGPALKYMHEDRNKYVSLLSTIILHGLSVGQTTVKDRLIKDKKIIPEIPGFVKEIEKLTTLTHNESVYLYHSLYLFGHTLGNPPKKEALPILADPTVSPIEQIMVTLCMFLNNPPEVLKFFISGIGVGDIIPAHLVSTARSVQGGSRDRHDWDEIKNSVNDIMRSSGVSKGEAKRIYWERPGAPSRSQLNRRIPDGDALG